MQSLVVDLEPLSGDPAELRQAYGCFPSGVVALRAPDGKEPADMVASSFPCVRNSSATWPHLRQAGRLGVSVMAEGQRDACRRLSLRAGDRFAGVGWESLPRPRREPT